MKFRIFPNSLAARTATVLLFGLVIVQAAGLTIHTFDRIDLQRLGEARNVAVRVVSVYRTMALTDPAKRASVLAELHRGPDVVAVLSDSPPEVELPMMPPPEQRLLRVAMNVFPLEGRQFHWRELQLYGGFPWHKVVIGLRMPDGQWLNVTTSIGPVGLWHSPDFLIAFGSMTLAASLLTLWAVRRLTAPVRVLAAAAEALGRDVNAARPRSPWPPPHSTPWPAVFAGSCRTGPNC